MARTRGASGAFSALADPSLPPSLQVPRPVPDAPYDWGGWIDCEHPGEVDVGCGLGRFLLARAAQFPGTRFLGIEREVARIAKIDLAARRRGLENIRLFCADALQAVTNLLPPGSVTALYVLFPDPWPKRRHWKRRLVSPAFLEGVARILRPAGALHLATDRKDYFAAMQRSLGADARFASIPAFSRTSDEQTDFERIFRRQGLPIYEASFLLRR